MAVSVVLSEVQRAALEALCDTFAAPVERDDDPTGFWARTASDLQIPALIEQQLAGGLLPEEQLDGLRQLLDALAAQGIVEAPPSAREQIVRAFMEDPQALAGLGPLKGLTHLLFYALPDPQTGRNPNWEAIGYPGPRAVPPSPDEAPKTIPITRPKADALELTCDVVVVGSGAGGGVIAGHLAGQGKDVVVVEAGGYYNEADFNQLELWAYEHLYRAGGLAATADGQISLMTGANLGGGTTVNWTNCLRTYPWVREEWEREHGLEGLAGPDYDRILDAVSARVNVTDQCSDWNPLTETLQRACEARGHGFQRITRNADPARYDADLAGLMGFGDVTGAKNSTQRTWLQDAADAGARFVVNCRAERVLVEGGRAAGVEGTYLDAEGRAARVIVRAATVVAAAGALDTPALLLRSGIGGPAAGDHLRLHPATAVAGFYEQPQKGWWGPPQSGLSTACADLEDGYGYLIETSHGSPGVSAAAFPWHGGEAHKEIMASSPVTAAFVFLIRDRGHGRVTIDAAGNPVHTYPFDDELDQRLFRHGLEEMVRLHDAAGATGIATFHRTLEPWRRDGGEPLEDFVARVRDASLAPFDHATFSLHHMGSARMGRDPRTSVANGWGELHDTPGVWIGDASGFPTASGTNPMLTTMALALRTAEAIADGRGA
jgi:choline dehydrogenase-like flavoprotein